jgi:hypothetical protein
MHALWSPIFLSILHYIFSCTLFNSVADYAIFLHSYASRLIKIGRLGFIQPKNVSRLRCFMFCGQRSKIWWIICSALENAEQRVQLLRASESIVWGKVCSTREILRQVLYASKACCQVSQKLSVSGIHSDVEALNRESNFKLEARPTAVPHRDLANRREDKSVVKTGDRYTSENLWCNDINQGFRRPVCRGVCLAQTRKFVWTPLLSKRGNRDIVTHVVTSSM